jgi:serine incorporator 1/3
VSFSTAVFFAIMMVFAAIAPITHLGGWLVKVFLYALVLGLSFLATNDTMTQYADVARGFSVVFLLAQVLIIIDFAYNTHEFMVRKMDAADEAASSGEGGGCCCGCRNGWRWLYLASSFLLVVGSLCGLGVLYHFYGGGCPLHNFFISETLVIGLVLTVVSMMNVIGKGLLPPAILFAYNTYLCYGALTNNPDVTCNPSAAAGAQSEVSIYAGVVIAAFSVTWMAFSSAGSMYSAVRMDAQGQGGGDSTSSSTRVENPVTPTAVSDWPGGGKGKDSKPAGTAAAYQAGATSASSAAAAGRKAEDEDDDDEEAGAGARGGRHPADDSQRAAAEKPWIFHLIMCLAGMYLAMLVTNWGNPADSTGAGPSSGNPELSAASMWARIGSQWAIHAIFVWTLCAPVCFPNRDFSR